MFQPNGRITSRQPAITYSLPTSHRNNSYNTGVPAPPSPALDYHQRSTQRIMSRSPLHQISGNPPVTVDHPRLLDRIMTEADEFLSRIQLSKEEDVGMAGVPSRNAVPPANNPESRQDIREGDLPISPNSETAVDSLLGLADSDGMEEDEYGGNDSASAERNAPAHQDISSVSSSTTTTYDECRRLLADLIVKNAARRGKDVPPSSGMHPDRIAEHVASIITDEHCRDFIEKSKKVKEQMELLKPKRSRFRERLASSTTSRKDSDTTLVEFPVFKNIPRAPRAMLADPKVRASVSYLNPAQSGTHVNRVIDISTHTPASRWSIPPLGSNITFGSTQAANDNSQQSPPAPYAPLAEAVHQRLDVPVPLDPEFSNSVDNSTPLNTHQTEPPIIEKAISTQVPETPPQPGVSPFPVPGLWFARVGLGAPDILEVPFEVDQHLLVHPAERRSNDRRTIITTDRFGVSLQLLCLSTDRVASIQQTLDTDATTQAVTDAICGIETIWPPATRLVIDINAGQHSHMSWLPKSTTGPLDLTPYIHLGTNTVRFIQLADLAEYVFVLQASPREPPRSATSADLDKQLGLVEDLILDRFLTRLQDNSKTSVDQSGVFEFTDVKLICEVNPNYRPS